MSAGDRVARARCPRSSVEAGQKCIENFKEQEKTTFFSPSENRVLACINVKTSNENLLSIPERQCT